MTFVDLIWLFFLLSSLQPMLAQRWLVAQRDAGTSSPGEEERFAGHNLDSSPRRICFSGHPLWWIYRYR